MEKALHSVSPLKDIRVFIILLLAAVVLVLSLVDLETGMHDSGTDQVDHSMHHMN